MRPEEVQNWTEGQIRDAWFGEWQEEGRVEQFFLVPDPGGPVEKLLGELYRYDRFEQARGEHAHVVLVCNTWHRADLVAITQRRELDHRAQPLKDREVPVHNRYRRLGPGQAPPEALVPNEGVCCWTAKDGAWRYERTRGSDDA
jgi:hypothetical protein